MKTNEIIEKKLKKYSAVQLLAKLEKGNLPESEKEVAIEILDKRGQDVSKFKPVPIVEPGVVKNEVEEIVKEKVEVVLIPTRQQLIEEIDEFVDALIEDHRGDVYTEVMKVLGGNFDSDIDDLFENATEEQLKEALSFKNIKSKKSETLEVKSVKKVVEPKKEVQEFKRTKKELEIPKDIDLEVGDKVSFIYQKTKEEKQGFIIRYFFYKKANKNYFAVKDLDGHLYYKSVKSVKKIN